MTTASKFCCDTCGEEYDSEAEAAKCEAKPLQKAAVKVGDIVTLQAGYGWYDGKRAWVSNAVAQDPAKTGQPRKNRGPKCPHGDTNCFGECCTFAFYYVVTHIDSDEGSHRARYHVETLAMSGKQGHRSGWTCYPGHYRPVPVKAPASVIRAAKKLVGNKFENLL